MAFTIDIIYLLLSLNSQFDYSAIDFSALFAINFADLATAPYLLIVLSAFTHAYWNFVLKRTTNGQIFIGLSKVAEAILFFVPFVYLIGREEIAILNYWAFYTVGAILVIFNYFLLGQAYKCGELSLVYPVSRAGALLFLPLLAYFFIDERLDSVGVLSILLIIAGLFTIQLTAFTWNEYKLVVSKFRNSATLLAILAAFTAACYTLWDKHSISFLPPFIYFYGYTLITAACYAVFIFVKYPFASIKGELATHKFAIVEVGFFNTFTYLLVLYSLQTGKSSYVIAIRQLSIAFGAFLGWKFLNESFPLTKKCGVGLLLAGCLLITLAR